MFGLGRMGGGFGRMGAGARKWRERPVRFAGAPYLLKTGGWSGAADNNLALIFLSLKFAAIASAQEQLLSSGANVQSVFRFSTAFVVMQFKSTADVLVISKQSTNTVGAERVNTLFSINTLGTTRFYMQRESSPGVWTWAQENSDAVTDNLQLDWTPSVGAAIGAAYDGANPLNASFYRAAQWIGIAPDITTAEIQNLFTRADGSLQAPGNSVAALGAPIVDFHGPASQWNAGINKGTGGNAVMTGGTVTDGL